MEHSYYVVLSNLVTGVDLLFYAIGGLISAAMTALAYVTWESYGRKQQQEQIPLLDAIWTGNIFQKRIGKAVLAGYGYAGLSLALWAFGLYSFDSVFFQVDQQLGFTDPASSFPAFTTLLNSWMFTWSAAAIYFGIIITILQEVIAKTVLRIPLAALLAGLLMSSGFSFVSVTGDGFTQFVVFVLLVIPLVMAFIQYGLLTVAVSIWVVYIAVRLGVYMGSPDMEVAFNGWVLALASLTPLAAGMLMYHYGRDDIGNSNFVPEYVARLDKQSRMEREFQIAKESQFALMPRSAPEIAGVDIKGFFIPSFDVGGDFYEHVVVTHDDNHADELVVAVVDVSGKAMKAALTAIYTSGLLMARAMGKESDPAQALRDINAILHARTDKLTFVTCALMRLNTDTRMMSFVNAGHCHPVLVRNGKASFLTSDGVRLPLGVRADVPYVLTQTQLTSGDTLYLYSDGLPEARNKAGDLFGFEEVLALFEKATRNHDDAATICENIKQEMLTFSDYELADDLTLVVVKV
jgi:hypothetical protein